MSKRVIRTPEMDEYLADIQTSLPYKLLVRYHTINMNSIVVYTEGDSSLGRDDINTVLSLNPNWTFQEFGFGSLIFNVDNIESEIRAYYLNKLII